MGHPPKGLPKEFSRAANPAAVDPSARGILKILSEGGLSTSAIALASDLPAGSAYRRCRELEKNGLLESTKAESDKKLPFCLDCEAVVLGSDYESCRADNHDIRWFHPKTCYWQITEIGRRALSVHR